MNYFKRLLTAICFLFVASSSMAQWNTTGNDIYNTNSGNVGIGTSTPHASALLDVFSTTQGVKFPTLTTTQQNAISSPISGLIIYNSDSAAYCYYNGSAWQRISVGTSWGLRGNAGTSPGTDFIGTTDNARLIFKVNNVQSGLINFSNTAFGYQSLLANTDGEDMTAFGYGALKSNTEGTANTAIGRSAMSNNTTGEMNVAVGSKSLLANISGVGNVAVGAETIASNSTGGVNTAVGFFVLRGNTSGAGNTGVGANALEASNGDNNTAIGVTTLYANVTGSNNIAVGHSGGKYIVSPSNIFVVNSIDRTNYVGDTTKSILYGVQNSSLASQRLKINGFLQVNDGNQGAGKVFTSDADGIGTWQTLSGGAAGNENNIQFKRSGVFTGNDSLKWEGARFSVPNHSTANNIAEFGTFGIGSLGVNNGFLTDNATYNGTLNYRNNGFISGFQFTGGAIYFMTAGSGTAGNPATIKYPMYIDNATPANTLYLNSSGNVGIGTNSPGNKLHVAGASYLDGIKVWAHDSYQFIDGGTGIFFISNTQSGGILRLEGSSTVTDGGVVAARSLRVFSDNNATDGLLLTPNTINTKAITGTTTLTIGANNISTAYFDNAGNLGIGSASSGYKFHVNGTANFTGNVSMSSFTTSDISYMNTGTTTSLVAVTSGGTPGIQITDNVRPSLTFNLTSLVARGIGLLNSDGDIGINIPTFSGLTTHIFYGNGNTFLYGKVGIGVVNTLTDYKLAVAGNIIAEKVKVKLQSAGWPDYVFNNDYELRTLKETEQFIQQNKHLPEVPSASDIEKNGLDLGDGQAVLLKKIEEMTLHMIEMNKRIEKLEAENEKMKKDLQKN